MPALSYELRAISHLIARSSELLCLNGHRLGRSLFLLPISDGGPDGVFGQYRAMDLHRRQRQFPHDLSVLDREGFVNGLALDPLGSQRRRGDGRTAAEGLELGVFDDVGFAVDLDLQLHDVAALGRADQAGAHVRTRLVHRADVAGMVVVIDPLVAICHLLILQVSKFRGFKVSRTAAFRARCRFESPMNAETPKPCNLETCFPTTRPPTLRLSNYCLPS